jgi:periplasmic protein CpxP/Spy
MKQRFKIAACLLSISVLIFSSFSMAQPQSRPMPLKGGPMSPEKRTKELKKELNLSSEQEKKILNIFAAQDDEMMKMIESEMNARELKREEMDKDRDAMHEKMEQQRKDMDAKISAVLTDEQKKKFEEFYKNHAQQPPRMRRSEDKHGRQSPEDFREREE